MLNLSAKIRDKKENPKALRKKGVLPAVLYGPGQKTSKANNINDSGSKNLLLSVDKREFERVYKQAGESSLISLEIEKHKEKPLVMIYDIQRHPLTDEFIHIDFYQPPLSEKIEAKIPLVFEGTAPAVKELNGTLVKNIQEIEVKAFPQDLPHEIKVNIEGLKTFEDNILVKDIKVGENIEILRKPEEIVASVTPPAKVEKELEQPIEEKVEEVEKVGETEKTTENETTKTEQ